VLNFFDRGYAWVIPRGELINFGVGGFYTRYALKRAFEENLKFFDLRPKRGFSPRTSACLVGGPVRKLRRGKLVAVGEAAGAVMSTTGEGIRFALWSGGICFRTNYERLFWQGYGERLRFSATLLRFIQGLSDSERLELLRRSTAKLQAKLLEGFAPDPMDIITMPWLLRYLKKLYTLSKQKERV
jgi:flavin-dependent dehydrogenase